jgi:hypothetical protein
MRIAAAAVAIAALGIAGAAQTPDQKPASTFQGKLYRSVFSSGAGLLAPEDLATVAEPLRARLSKYLARRATFKSSYKSAPDDLNAVRSDAKRRVLERSLVSLIDTPGVEKMAAEFVAAAPIAHEWEGLPDRPLAEAEFAENALKKDPSSPLAPWFYVFIAQRQRVAFEGYENQKNEEGMKASAKKYRAFLERARAAGDPIYGAVVDDMEAQPFLYIRNTRNPRDYDPDS